MTINALKARIYVDELNAIRLPGFAEGMLEAYKDAEAHPNKIQQHAEGVHRRYIMFLVILTTRITKPTFAWEC